MNDEKMLQFYMDRGIIGIDDLCTLGREGTMNKILKEIHPYSIWQNETDGRWYTYISDETALSGRKRINRTKRDALERFLLEHYHVRATESVYTFNSLWTEFEQYRNVMQKKNTVKEDVKAYKRFYENASIANVDLETLNPVDLEMWLKHNIDKYKLNQHSYSKMKAPFSQLYQYAIRKGYIKNNPFALIDTNKLGLYNESKKVGKEKAFMLSEQPDIYKAAWDDFVANPYPVPIGVLLAFQTGLRIGELVALRWEDIDWEDKTLKVCRYEEDEVEFSDDFKSMSNYHYVIYEYETKGAYGERIVDLTEDAIFLLEILRDYYKENEIATPWIFYSKREGDKCHDRAFDIRIRKYCRLANLPIEKSMHKIRSTFVSNLRQAGMSYERIAEQCGHKNIKTTMNNYSFDLEDRETNRNIMNKGLCFFKRESEGTKNKEA